jgi:RHS repeat-associated protein
MVTVTDQAGKSRRSVTDALGRMTEVIEDPNGLAYATDYAYDALGNLRRVSQGGQFRYFMYDSLSRLLRVKLPEQLANANLAVSDPVTGNSQWSAGYVYDNGGNLTQRTDARGVVTNYAYDALSRNTTVDYSDTSVNPDISRFYDGATLGKGRFWYSYAGGDWTNGATVEHEATDAYDAAGRPLTQRQLFKTAGAWGATYQTSRAYNLAGGVVSETYPSGHTVSYTYDAAGRLASFAGNLGDSAQRTYSSGAVYDEAGRVTQEQFGTQTALYHQQQFNARGQMTDARLGTSSVFNSLGSWDRGALINDYGTTDNNGNLHNQQYWFQTDLQGSYTQTQQNYSYDSMNRLASMNEYRMGTYSFQQFYSYDRYGNRQIDAANTTTGINKTQFSVDTATNRLTNAGIVYDAAGNVITDTYSATSAQRSYDAEGRMTMEQNSATSIFSYYTYDASGQRTRRNAGGNVTWMIYGMGGELVAEYAQNAVPASPQKEYGYRGGELLVTAAHTNVAASANGASVTAQNYTPDSAYPGLHFQPSYAADGDRHIEPPQGDRYWRDEHGLPTWVETDFAGAKAVDEVDVMTVGDYPAFYSDPSPSQTFTQYGVTAFDVQYWTGSAWQTVQGGSVTNNNLVWKKISFPAVTTTKIRVVVNAAADGVARIAEVEAYATEVRWVMADHLGTPRITVDQTGSLASVTRHDYLPFGEELPANQWGRTSGQGYAGDSVKQKYTGYERDAEARYHSDTQGRFTSPDPYGGSMEISDPQTFNRYSYVGNKPTIFSDPSGMSAHPGTYNLFNYNGAMAAEEHSTEMVGSGDPPSQQITILCWTQLSAEQRRLFTSYYASTHPDAVEPAAGAAVLWNCSVILANRNLTPPPNSGILVQSQVTAFIGVVSMWEHAEVTRNGDRIKGFSGYVSAITNIAADNGKDTGFRLDGIFIEGGGEFIMSFWYKSKGEPKGDYTRSYRERESLNSKPNGQFTLHRTNNRLFDSDVDYKARWNPQHLGHYNSDIRSDDHLEWHVHRYGAIPLLRR